MAHPTKKRFHQAEKTCGTPGAKKCGWTTHKFLVPPLAEHQREWTWIALRVLLDAVQAPIPLRNVLQRFSDREIVVFASGGQARDALEAQVGGDDRRVPQPREGADSDPEVRVVLERGRMLVAFLDLATE